MSIASAPVRRRAVLLVVGVVAGLATVAQPALSRVEPAPTVLAFSADTTPPTTTISGGQSNPQSFSVQSLTFGQTTAGPTNYRQIELRANIVF